jgi:hypothetical protein
MNIKSLWERLKKHSSLLIVLLILAAGIAAYANSFQNEFVYDDINGIVNNTYIKDWKFFPNYFSQNFLAGAGFLDNYWRPILLTTFSAEWHLWKNWVPGFHIVNTSVHILNAILVFFILFYLFSAKIPAAIAAIIFAIHPLQTEAVTYISGLADPLSLLFLLIGIYLFIKIRTSTLDLKNRNINYLIIYITFLLALMTKERSVIFPALLILIDIFIWKTREILEIPFIKFAKQVFFRVTPFILTSIGFLVLRATTLNFQNIFNIHEVSNYYTEHITSRLFTFFSVLPTYFSLFFAPIGLHMERSTEVLFSQTLFEPWVLIGTGLILALILFAIISWKEYPTYTFGILWFFITIFPASGIVVPVAGILYEHYMYAPIIGLSFLIGLFGFDIYKKFENKKIHYAIIILGLTIVVFFITQTAIQNRVNWKNQINLAKNTLRYIPQNLRMGNGLGMLYAEAEDFENSEKTYKSIIFYNPNSPIPHHNLGNLYYQMGKLEEAEKEYKIAISISPESPLPYQALYRLFLDKKDLENAEKILNQLKLLRRP